jgi:GNAT superfamily N-acetyltransferase
MVLVHVRPAQSKDREALFDLVRLFPTPTPPTVDAYFEAFRAKLLDSSAFLAVAEDGAALVGYVSGYCHTTFYAGGKTAWIDELLVVSRCRQQGVGRLLMQAFEAWAQENGCKLVSLATAGASGFYERLGYGTKAGYYKKYLPDAGSAD